MSQTKLKSIPLNETDHKEEFSHRHLETSKDTNSVVRSQKLVITADDSSITRKLPKHPNLSSPAMEKNLEKYNLEKHERKKRLQKLHKVSSFNLFRPCTINNLHMNMKYKSHKESRTLSVEPNQFKLKDIYLKIFK